MAAHHSQNCQGLSRRDAIAVGALSAFGLTHLDLVQRRLQAATTSTSKHCVLIWLDGGPSHLETFDPKPDAPSEVRGPFGTAQTSVPGIAVCDLLPRTAGLMKDFALVRSMTSPLGEHNFGTHYMLTGYKPTRVLEYPAFGSVFTHLTGKPAVLPNNIAVPEFRVGGSKFSGHGILPASARPFSVGGDPSKPGFGVRDLTPPNGLTDNRITRRRDFVNALDQFSELVEKDAPTDPDFEQAYRLVTSREAKAAFDLNAESPATRNRYGRKTIGQSTLLARRLIERGVPFVTVNNRGWDTHKDVVTRLRDGYTGAKKPVGLIPSLDLALSALLRDLKDRGLLDETLVVVMGEFGRTPKLNTTAGRDHWPRVFSVLMAGGGVRGGQVIGASDATGEQPHEHPVTPNDLVRTIYALLGIDPDHELHTADGRPVQVNQGGEVISQLLS